jgi:hypothetical protein
LAIAGGSSNSALYFLAIIVLIMLFRVRRVMGGTRVSVGRTLGYSAYYLVFGALVLSGSFFLPIPVEYFALYPVLFIATFLVAFELAKRRVVFWRSADGFIFSRGGLPIYLIYILGFVARVAIGYEYLGPNFLFSFTPTASLSSVATTATVATDLLLVAGIGLLFGRNMRILRKYLAVKSGKEQIETTSNDEQTPSSMPA